MDKLRKCRAATRSAFTRTYTMLLGELDRQQPRTQEIQILFALLKDKTSELEEWNAKFLEKYQGDEEIAEAELVKDIETQDEYKMKYLDLKFRVQTQLNPPAQIIDPNTSQGQNGTQAQNLTQANQTIYEHKRFKLPRIEPPKFSGDLKEWLNFWSLFKTIHEDESIGKEQKFNYLSQAMVENSRASELVNSFPPTAVNYDKAITCLTNRFGKKDLLVEMYIRELLKLVLNNAINNTKEKRLSSTFDKLKTQLRSLESLGVTTDMCAAMLYPLVESSLPEELLRAWQRHSTSSEIPDAQTRLNKFMDFLEAEVESEQRIDMAIQGFDICSANTKQNEEIRDKNKKKLKSDEKSVPTAAGLLTVGDHSSTTCIFCEDDHVSASCEDARKMTLEERTSKVKEKNACFRCLKLNHSYRFCKSKDKCAWCGKKHVLLMCREVQGLPIDEEKAKTYVTESALANVSTQVEVFLQTLRVKIVNGKKERVIRAIIDTGSHRSYISSNVAESLGYEVTERQTMIHSLFGGTLTQPQEHNMYKVHIRSLDDTFACNFDAYQQTTICQNVPKVSHGPWMQELRANSVRLSDVGEDHQPIALLIGADIAGKLYTGQIINLDCGATAVGTRLGWTLMGKTPRQSEKTDTAMLTLTMFAQGASIRDLWSLDVLGITDPIQSKTKEAHQQEVLQKFLDTTKINPEGRYEVLLPWKEVHSPLVDNRQMAEKRLERTLNTLKAQNLVEDYQKVFDDWLGEGIIERVPDEEVARESYYLPHRAVIKENSSTRIRPVFDASARNNATPSLNECLEPGPNLIELIPSLLMRFRERRLGITADIRRAFLQISVSPEERDAMRFLWKRDMNAKLTEVYRHCRVVFGISSSPFLLGATLNLHLDQALSKAQNDYEKASISKLKDSFYVDNCVSSVDSFQEAQEFQAAASQVLATGGFDLRAWEYTGMNDCDEQSSLLGLTWNKREDTLSLTFNDIQKEELGKITKRTILSVAQRLYDPLGMISPVLICPKLLIQKLWSKEINWDTEVDETTRESFVQRVDQLIWLKQLKIPRWAFGVGEKQVSVSLHAFVDASKDAYASVIFARVECQQQVKVNFVTAKSRVAPKGPTTIPRLELLAATIGARLMNSVVSSLKDNQFELYYWTDSSTVLAWIQRERQWATFDLNRVQEIRRLTDPTSWAHIPGVQNPADLPSRGCTAKYLADSNWYQGPEWLKWPSGEWPKADKLTDEKEVNIEIKKSGKVEKWRVESSSTPSTVHCALAVSAQEEIPWYMKKYSRYTKIVRLVSWVLRFTRNCQEKMKDKRAKNDLTVPEMRVAETVLLRLVQQETLDGEHDPRLKGMLIYRDEQGLLRLKTPVSYRDDTLGFRCPVLLVPHHPLVEKLIRVTHLMLNHGSIDVVLNKLRENVWILSSRRTVQSVIRSCVICRRFNVKKHESISIPLPESRVRDAATFEVTGVDLAGPLILKDQSKCWIVLFTCAVYRAIHLELVSSLSTTAFLDALRRFIARRGRPSILYCDNGTNFCGAANLLSQLNWERLVSQGTIDRIEWRFNPPLAAWWGGWWERLVRMVKELLRKTLKRACLSYEEMNTALCDCEAVINARPLTYLAEDPHQLIPLSPDMFLRDLTQHGVPDVDAIDSRSLNKRVKYRQRLREELRERFRSEYLGQLKTRRNTQPRTTVKEGDLVFIGSDIKKRLEWPLGKIVQLFPGKDGEARVAKLKTASVYVTRPIQRLFPLEVTSREAEKIIPSLLEHKEFSRVNEDFQHSKIKDSSLVEVQQKPPDVVSVDSRLVDDERKTTTRRGRVIKKPNRFLN